MYDVTVQNNSDYTNDYLAYLNNELGLTDYSLDTNALFNQYYFADSSDANNIYLTVVPNLRKNKSVVTRSNYLSNALKEKIRTEIADYKLLNSEIAFIDPVYLNLDLSLNTKFSDDARDYGNGNRTWDDERLDDYLVNDLSIKYNLYNTYNLFFDINNILDEKYETVRDYSQMDRSYNFGIRRSY